MRSWLLAAALPALALGTLRPGKPVKYDTNFKGYRDDVLNIHIVSHTHDDVGWLKTVDEYFIGANNSIQNAHVGNVLDSVLVSLQKDPSRKFTYVEQAFFQRWWAEQDGPTQAAFKELVANGQLTFINGGWCMHDEAAPGYIDMIDQTTLGKRYIKEEFGAAANPQTTWQIDPFGHSATQSSLMTAASGYQALYFARMDYEDYQMRINTSALEFIWQSSPSLGAASRSLTGMLYGGYGPISWDYCFDVTCDGIPIQDDPALENWNVNERMETFINMTLQQAASYRGGHIMLTMGSDFQYQYAEAWYKGLDKLIHYGNTMYSGQVNIFYSNPTQYTQAKLAANITWPVVQDDFFPYRDSPHAPWTGYFTSRAALKAYVRETSSIHTALRQLQTLAGGVTDLGPSNALYTLERAMGVAQHHDAVSGTSQQHVADDYAKRLSAGRAAAQPLLASTLAHFTGYTAESFVTCELSNVTICPPLEAGVQQAVLLYNPLSAIKASLPVMVPVGLPAGVKSYSVVAANGDAITAQLLPLSASDASLRAMYEGSDATVMWLAFFAGDIPALGYSTFFIVPAATADAAPATHISVPRDMVVAPRSAKLRQHAAKGAKRSGSKGVAKAASELALAATGDQTVSNGRITLTISGSTGMVSGYADAVTGIQQPLTQSWFWYNSSIGNNAESHQSSGAYIFRPNSTSAFAIEGADSITVSIVEGPVVSEVRQAFGYVAQAVRLWANASWVDFQYDVGHLPIDMGHEVVTRYSTGLATAGTWWTDSNGRELRKRVRFFRPHWNLTVTEPISGEYYPVNFAIATADVRTGTTLSVVTDRTQGGSSLVDGSVELMVHRRLQHDDDRGVGQPLNETGVDGLGLTIRGLHRLQLSTAATARRDVRFAMADATFRPLTTFAPVTGPAIAWGLSFTSEYSGLTAPLPPNLQVLTAHAQDANTLLLRLAHNFEVGEDATYSANATVSLSSLFAPFTITSVVETDLSGATPLAELPRYTLRGDDGSVSEHPVLPEPMGVDAEGGITVTLTPMQIRTFFATIAPASTSAGAATA